MGTLYAFGSEARPVHCAEAHLRRARVIVRPVYQCPSAESGLTVGCVKVLDIAQEELRGDVVQSVQGPKI